MFHSPSNVFGKAVKRFSRSAALLALALVPSAFPPHAASAREVRVATYNILQGTGAIGSEAYNATRAVLQRIDADVVCFQELYLSSYAPWTNMAAELGYPYAAIGGNNPLADSLYLGFFSRHPILATNHVSSPPGAVEHTRFPFRAVIDIPDALHPLVVWTTHHKSGAASLDKFRRAIEALRVSQDIAAYLADHPGHVELVLTGDMNDDIRDAQTPASFSSQPSGAPGYYALGPDVAFPVAYATFPADRYAGAGGGMVRVPAFWEGTATPVTRPSSSRQLDYLFLSPALANNPLGAPKAEVYHSAADSGGGLPKLGAPLDAGVSDIASDHLPVFVDLQMADYSCVVPVAAAHAAGEAGGPFDLEFQTYVLTETNAFETAWIAEPDVDWLSVDADRFTLAPFAPFEVDVFLNDNAARLPPGVHVGSVSFLNETTGLLETREFVLILRDYLAVSPPGGFVSAGLAGGPFAPASATYVVTNKSAFAIPFTATATPNWLTLSPSAWLLQAGQAVEVRVALDDNASGLPPGAYAATVVFSNQTTGLTADRSASLSIAGHLCDALDACDLTWSTGGDAPWVHQTEVAADGADAARSGTLGTSQTSWMETVVQGPVRIAFDWKVSSRSSHYLRFLVDGSSQASLSGEADWSRRLHDIASGVHTLRWAYATSATAPQGSNAAWVDRVAVDRLSISPATLWVASGLPGGPFSPSTRTYVLTNSGALPLPWSVSCDADWLEVSPASGVLPPNGSADVGLVLNGNANLKPLGTYPSQLVFSNLLAGFAQERPVLLATTGSLCDALEACQLDWTTGGDAPWYNQTATTFDGADAAQSGSLSTNQQSWIETVVQGPAKVGFHWRVSSRSSHYLRFHVDDVQRTSISGVSTSWVQRAYDIPAGAHTLRWSYVTTGLAPQNANAGWLDRVVVDRFAVSPTNGWHASGNPGGPFTPASRAFALENRGDASLSWAASANVDWLSIDPPSGSLPPGERVSVSVSLAASAALLPAGSHPAALVFSNLTSGLPLPVPAFLDTRGTLCEAVDACFLDWSSGGAVPWFPQTAVSSDGVDAAQSGVLSTNQETWMEALVEGPAQLRFQWRVSSRTNTHYLSFLIDGATRARASGETEWATRFHEIAPGIHTVRWSYATSSAAPSNSNAAWVDQVALDPFAVLPMDSWTATGLPGGPFFPDSRTYVVTNSGTQSLAWTATPYLNWISADPSSGELGPGESTSVEMHFNTNAAALSIGSRTATVSFSNLASGASLQRSATLALRDHLVVTPSWAYHTGFVGGPFSPESQLFALSNAGPVAIEWTLLGATNWLSPDSFSGSLEPGETGQVLVALNEEANLLPAGWTISALVFSNVTTRLIQSPGVYLDLQDPLVLSSPGWTATGPVGGPFSPASATLTLTNRSPLPQQWTLSADSPWLSLGAAGGTLEPGTALSLAVSLSDRALELPAGLHTASLLLDNLSNGTVLTQTVHLAAGVVFCDAVEACNLEWTLGGDAPWQYQTDVTHDGIDALASGAIGPNQESWLQTAATGPGTLSFWWRVSSESGWDHLEFWIDGVLTNRISGSVAWQPQTFTVPAGSRTFRWRYMKDGSGDAGSDRGWLDAVTWSPASTAMGVPVAWYQRFGLAPGASETYDDLDWKLAVSGSPHWVQYLAGLDPTNRADVFRILEIRQVLGQPVRIGWWGGTNGPATPYLIQSAADLDLGPWNTVGSSSRAPGLNVWTNTQPAGALRFYRIQAIP